jgi:GNAT superfamily N-acetyltransferase
MGQEVVLPRSRTLTVAARDGVVALRDRRRLGLGRALLPRILRRLRNKNTRTAYYPRRRAVLRLAHVDGPLPSFNLPRDNQGERERQSG